MKLRHLGLNVQELEAGPFVFLISYSVPVAYHDTSETGPLSWFRTERNFNKATTRHLNKWLEGKRVAIVPHDIICSAFQSISRFTEQPARMNLTLHD